MTKDDRQILQELSLNIADLVLALEHLATAIQRDSKKSKPKKKD